MSLANALRPASLQARSVSSLDNEMNKAAYARAAKNIINNGNILDSDSSSEDSWESEDDNVHMSRHNNCRHSKKKPNVRGYKYKKSLIKKIAELNGNDGYKTKDLCTFLKPDSRPEVEFNRNGQIIISGIMPTIPDLSKKEREEYIRRLQEIRNLTCSDKKSVQKWTKASIITTAVLLIVLLVFVLMYILYNSFFSN